LGEELGLPHRVGVEADQRQLRKLASELSLEPLGASPEAREVGRAARRAHLRRALRVAAVMAPQRLVAVQDETDVAVRAANRLPACAEVGRGRDAAAVEEQDRLAPGLRDRAELVEEGRRERVPSLAAQVDDLHGGKLTCEPPAELEPL